MKLEEDAWWQQQKQQQQVVPIARKDDGNPGSPGKCDGHASRETRPAVGAGHTDATDTATERKKAAGKTVKVSVLGDGSPKSVLKNANNCAGRRSNAGGREMEIPPPNPTKERPETLTSQPLRNVTQATKTQEDDAGVTVTRRDEDKPRGSDVHGEGDHVDDDESGGDHVDDDDADAGDHHENKDGDDDDEDDDDADSSVTLSGDCESHFITTHEIQLSELSDEEDEGRDVEAGSVSEEGGQVYAFVDYAYFVDVDADVGGGASDGGRRHHVGSDPPKTQHCGGNDQSGGAQVRHLSIKTTSRAINEPSSSSGGSIQEQQGGVSGGGKTSFLDGAKCFIAAPGRLHFGRALKGREAAGCCCSSGSSARSSEPDDADKEVRHLTGRAFKSLAYPCLGAIRFSSSSESSALVDLKYGTLAMDRLVAARQNPTSSFGVAPSVDRVTNNNNTSGYKGVIKAHGNHVFTLKKNNNNNEEDDDGGNSSTQNVELLRGNFGHFTLTETLNFRCDVESRVSGGGGWGERRAGFAQSAATVSRCAGEVTATSPAGGRRQKRSGGVASPCNAARATMGDTHKKAMFASSLLKNVISKKMQFEEERKMERGEICERQRGVDGGGGKGPRELQRQCSRFSEASSDNTIVCLEELGDMAVDTGSGEGDTIAGDCPPVRAEDAFTPVPEARSEWPNEARMDPVRRGASDAARNNSTLPRSQNSAFRSWRDGEIEFQREHKNDKTPEEVTVPITVPSADNSAKLKKMSHLFVPTIQTMPNECEAEKQLPTMDYSLRGSELVEGGMELLSDTRYDADSRRMKTSKSPEIKINLRVRDNKKEPFGVAHLRPHNNAPGLTRTDDSRCQGLAAVLKGECSDKVPHFMVRDIRDNKAKLQTPIHQVRDVRKLMKSSYHFVSLDNNDTKSSLTTGGDCRVEQKKQGPYRNQASVSPIVIKCQSVNTNSNGKQSGNLIDSFKIGVNAESQCETDIFGRLSPEGAKGGSSLFHRPLEPPNKGDSFEGSLGLNIDTNSASTGRQEKASDNTDKKPETSANNQTAFSKLQAAVKTMEQLYVFDRNEWKRKSEPRPVTDGHLLSVMTSHEHGGEEEPDYNRPTPGKDGQVGRGFYPHAPSVFRDSPRSLGVSMLTRGEVRDVLKPFQHPTNYEDRLGFKPIPAQGGPAKNVCDYSVFGHNKPTENHGNARPSMPNPQPAKGFVPQSPKLPVSVRISQVGKQRAFEAKSIQGGGCANLQDYLTMPLKSQTDAGKRVHTVQPSTTQDKAFYTSAPVPPRPQSPQKQYGPRATETTITTAASTRSLEITPPALPTLYSPFPLGMLQAQPQVFCFSPAMSPAPAALDPFQATQRKMLLDPTTGNYYLVDTPVQPATKRLLDPETGQYVDVPMPQQSMAAMTPMSMPQMALSPYMFYPGFMPGPMRTLAQQVMCMPQAAETAADRGGDHHGVYVDNPYYVAMGKSPLQQARTPLMSGGKTQPVVSVTSQQGPRIVAPPSFDGTTMSFVVEHR